MTQENFNEAILIIAGHHSSVVTINAPKNNFVGDLGDKKFRLHVNRCVPKVIEELSLSGYSLSMTDDGLLVDKY